MQISQLPSAATVSETDKLPIQQGTLTKYSTIQQILEPRVQSVEDAATLNIDVTGCDHIAITALGQNTTINLTGGVPWQKYTVSIPQDATGSRTVTLGGSVALAAGDSFTATTTANKTDILAFMVGPTDAVHYLSGQKKGF